MNEPALSQAEAAEMESRTRRIADALMIEGSQKIDELINERDRLKSDRAKLVEVLRAAISHERTIVSLFNAQGMASPAMFSVACEQARSVLRELGELS